MHAATTGSNQRELFEGLLRRSAVALRSRGRFDAANEAENWIDARAAARRTAAVKVEMVGQVFQAKIIHDTVNGETVRYGLELIKEDRERAFAAIRHLIPPEAFK